MFQSTDKDKMEQLGTEKALEYKPHPLITDFWHDDEPINLFDVAYAVLSHLTHVFRNKANNLNFTRIRYMAREDKLKMVDEFLLKYGIGAWCDREKFLKAVWPEEK